MSNLWISQVKHQDPTTDINVGSPTLVKLDSGELLAAHDYQGKGIYRQLESDRYTISVCFFEIVNINIKYIENFNFEFFYILCIKKV